MINRTAPKGLAPGRGQKLAINALKALANPAKVVKQILRRLPGLPVSLKLELDLYDRPAYAFGIAQAAREAKALGIESIVVVELGVASGRGLLAMEEIARDISRATGVKIGVVGFDTGRGLPPPTDYRDLPYLYSGGFYPMDSDALRRRIGTAELVIGEVRETVPDFLRGDRPPIGSWRSILTTTRRPATPSNSSPAPPRAPCPECWSTWTTSPTRRLCRPVSPASCSRSRSSTMSTST